MTWLRLEDNFAHHPKIMALSDRAFRLHLSALCHCAEFSTDGYVDKGIERAIRGRLAGDSRARTRHLNELVAGGLWAPVNGGYLIHDYLDYNPSAAEVKAKREQAAERQRRFREGK
jgi:hypothetical protein